MLGITYPGSEADIAILRAVRSGRPLDTIVEEFGIHPSDLAELYSSYLRYRAGLRRQASSRAEMHEAQIDTLEALIEVFWDAASRGDIESARFVVATRTAVSNIEGRIFRQELLLRGVADDAGDAEKAQEQGSGVDAAFRELERLHREYGLPVPPSIVQVYSDTLAREVSSDDGHGTGTA